MISNKNYIVIPRFSRKYCFGNVLSFLATPEDLKVIAFRVSWKMFDSFQAECKNICKFEAICSSDKDISICRKFFHLEALSIFRDKQDPRDLTNLGPNVINNLTSLRILQYRGTFNISCIRYFPRTLQELDLSYSQLVKEDLNSCSLPEMGQMLQAMPFLKNLAIRNFLGINNEFLAFFPTTLQKLNLADCSLSDEGLTFLQRLTDLQELRLDGNDVGDKAVSDLCSKLTKLEKLFLSRLVDHNYASHLSDACVVHLPLTLQVLSFNGSQISGAGLQFLHNLHTLSLNNCQNIRDKDLLLLPPNIHSLDISECQGITDEGIPNLPKNLRKLDVHGTQITGATFSSLPTTLTTLDVSASQVNDEALQNLPGAIEELGLTHCKITDWGLRFLQPKPYVTDADIVLFYLKQIPQQLLYAPSRLRRLKISYCSLISDQGLTFLPKLESLRAIGCKRITEEGIRIYLQRYNFQTIVQR